jgi:hypothetical protein
MTATGLGRVKTKSDLVVMSSGRQIFAFFCSPHDRRAQNSGCDYTPQSFYTARVINGHRAMPAPCPLSPPQRRKAHIAALMGFIFVIPVTRGRQRYAMADWSPSRRAIGAPVFYVKGEAGLPIVIRCHSGFRISRIELVHSLPPHGYKCIGSEFVH